MTALAGTRARDGRRAQDGRFGAPHEPVSLARSALDRHAQTSRWYCPRDSGNRVRRGLAIGHLGVAAVILPGAFGMIWVTLLFRSAGGR